MKARLILSALFFITSNLFAQSVNKTVYDNIYVFLTSETLTYCNGSGTKETGTNSTNDINAGAAFKITKIMPDGSYVIQFLKWPTTTDPQTKAANTSLNLGFFSSETNTATGETSIPDVYFALPLSVFTNDCDLKLVKNSFTLGALVLPIKIRFGGTSSNGHVRDFTFTNDVSIGLSLGYKYSPNKKYSHNLLTGISLTSVAVTPDNTNNAVTTATNLAAITWHFGYLFQIDNFQIGAFTGIDYLAGNVGRMWDYRNQPWFGIGIGYSIFKSKSTSDTQ